MYRYNSKVSVHVATVVVAFIYHHISLGLYHFLNVKIVKIFCTMFCKGCPISPLQNLL